MGALSRLQSRVTTEYATQAGVTLGPEVEPYQIFRSREIVRGRVSAIRAERAASQTAGGLRLQGLGELRAALPLILLVAAAWFLTRGAKL